MPYPELDPATPVGELFKTGPIQISILDIGTTRMRIGIDAPPGIIVLREELPSGGGDWPPAT
jgi:hypothetical protein